MLALQPQHSSVPCGNSTVAEHDQRLLGNAVAERLNYFGEVSSRRGRRGGENQSAGEGGVNVAVVQQH